MAEISQQPELAGFVVALDDAASRYVARSVDNDDEAGVLEFTVSEGVTAMTSTRTDPAYRGRGIARQLVTRALDDADEAGLLVDPRCWYVAQFIERNPEYAHLLVPGATTPEPPSCEVPGPSA